MTTKRRPRGKGRFRQRAERPAMTLEEWKQRKSSGEKPRKLADKSAILKKEKDTTTD
jgi:hypothetical protein